MMLIIIMKYYALWLMLSNMQIMLLLDKYELLPSIGSDIPWKTTNVRSREKARLNLRNRLGYK